MDTSCSWEIVLLAELLCSTNYETIISTKRQLSWYFKCGLYGQMVTEKDQWENIYQQRQQIKRTYWSPTIHVIYTDSRYYVVKFYFIPF